MNLELRNVSARILMTALLRDGFVHTSTTGSHRVFRHGDGRRVVLWHHAASETFGPKTLTKILRQTRWADADLRRLGLVSSPSETRSIGDSV